MEYRFKEGDYVVYTGEFNYANRGIIGYTGYVERRSKSGEGTCMYSVFFEQYDYSDEYIPKPHHVFEGNLDFAVGAEPTWEV